MCLRLRLIFFCLLFPNFSSRTYFISAAQKFNLIVSAREGFKGVMRNCEDVLQEVSQGGRLRNIIFAVLRIYRQHFKWFYATFNLNYTHCTWNCNCLIVFGLRSQLSHSSMIQVPLQTKCRCTVGSTLK